MANQKLQLARMAILSLQPGDFVTIKGNPMSAKKWEPCPGILVERFSNQNVTVCPITTTKGLDGIAVGPTLLPGIDADKWLHCDQNALQRYPSFIDLSASMTLGLLTPSPWGTSNWIGPNYKEPGNVHCLSALLTPVLKSLFGARRCAHVPHVPPSRDGVLSSLAKANALGTVGASLPWGQIFPGSTTLVQSLPAEAGLGTTKPVSVSARQSFVSQIFEETEAMKMAASYEPPVDFEVAARTFIHTPSRKQRH